MKHYAGLDVSLKETSICIVDETGSICREMKAPSHPEDLARVLQDPSWRLARIGAALHRSVGGRTEPTPSHCLSDADGLRASKLKHAVQGLNGDSDLRRATSVRS